MTRWELRQEIKRIAKHIFDAENDLSKNEQRMIAYVNEARKLGVPVPMKDTLVKRYVRDLERRGFI